MTNVAAQRNVAQRNCKVNYFNVTAKFVYSWIFNTGFAIARPVFWKPGCHLVCNPF